MSIAEEKRLATTPAARPTAPEIAITSEKHPAAVAPAVPRGLASGGTGLAENVTAAGVVFAGYVGPCFDGHAYSGQEVHVGFVAVAGPRWAQELEGALRYSQFHVVHVRATAAEWDALWQDALKRFARAELAPRHHALALPNELYGAVFPALFSRRTPPEFAVLAATFRGALEDGSSSLSLISSSAAAFFPNCAIL